MKIEKTDKQIIFKDVETNNLVLSKDGCIRIKDYIVGEWEKKGRILTGHFKGHGNVGYWFSNKVLKWNLVHSLTIYPYTGVLSIEK